MPGRPRVVYVTRPPNPRISRWERLKQTLVPWYLHPADGFLLASLRRVADVQELSREAFWRRHDRGRLEADVVAVNFKCGRLDPRPDDEVLREFDRVRRPKLLVVADDRPDKLPGDVVLDVFEVVFKREPYRDRDRYRVSAANRAKLHATMLGCPLIGMWSHRTGRIDMSGVGYPTPATDAARDAFFAGSATDPERIAILQALHGNLDLHASVQPGQQNHRLPPELVGPRLDHRRFSAAIRDARINLALAGYGPFTHRHLELHSLAAFVVSNPGIRDLELVLDLVEGEHYVAFDDPDDLVDKCRHYLDHEDERLATAAAGRRAFERGYSLERHGAAIRAVIDRIR